jgi:multicomponent Na+:H+ antiporter subunit G
MEMLAGIIMTVGAIVVLIGSIGMLRLPDFFCRLHSAGLIDTLGAWLVLLGLILLSDTLVNGFKVAMIGVLFLFLAPAASHAIARAAVQDKATKAD